MKKVILGTVLLLMSVVCFAGDFIIIANKSVGESLISKADVKNIFLGKKSTWSDGSAINAVILKGGDVHISFLKTAVKKSKSQFNTFWKKAIFTGTGTPPQKFDNEKAMLDYVAKTPGAIGYVSANMIDDRVNIIKLN